MRSWQFWLLQTKIIPINLVVFTKNCARKLTKFEDRPSMVEISLPICFSNGMNAKFCGETCNSSGKQNSIYKTPSFKQLIKPLHYPNSSSAAGTKETLANVKMVVLPDSRSLALLHPTKYKPTVEWQSVEVPRHRTEKLPPVDPK